MAEPKNDSQLMDKIVSLCKRRGFVFPGSEIYGGQANSWDYGPLGVEVKNNIKNLWWKRFVHERTDIVGLDAALIMNTKVWEASGHIKNFSDPLVECKKCHKRFRADELYWLGVLPGKNPDGSAKFIIPNDATCPNCNALAIENIDPYQIKHFNLMFKTHVGPVEDDKSAVYLRPETAQAMFVNFKNILDTTRKTLPFGIAQIGKAFRNEVTPGNFIFRTREFEQMEIEFFIKTPVTDDEWTEHFIYWRQQMLDWMKNDLGINLEHVHELEVPAEERAHYSKRTVDFEYDFPFGRKELYGLAYRGDFDLKNHHEASGHSLEYIDPVTHAKFLPHVIEPTWGVDRSLLALLCEAYNEQGEGKDKRVWLQFPPMLAPYKVAVFPLLKNKPQLVDKAKTIFDSLMTKFTTAWDDRGNVGKRYYSQDEIGTPYCVTVDFQTLEDDTVTIRDRDTTKQERIAVAQLEPYLKKKIYV